MANSQDFGLGESVLAVLPIDPFEQLDVARKITSIALSSRISKLESDASRLRQSLAEKDDLIAGLRAQVETLDASLDDLSRALQHADEEKASLLNENASLSNTVKKLNRDVSKLEVFKKTLMQSLHEEEDGSQAGGPKVVSRQAAKASFSTGSIVEGRTRVDGKEFFRQVRSRLSYEQFSSFLASVKELNSHKQTREETLGKAEEIFGADNKDLYTIFEGLITRNIH